MRIERHQRHLHRGNSLTFFLPSRVALLQEFVHADHSGIDCRAGGALKVGVERGVNTIALRLQVGFGELLKKVVFHHVHKIGRGNAAEASDHEVKLVFLGAIGLLLGDVAVLDHLRENTIAPFDGALHVPLGGRITIRRAYNSRQEGHFREIHLANILAEIGLSAFAESPNGKAAAITQVNFVRVQLENLLLRKTLVNFKSHQRFFHLAAPLALGGKEKASRYLHVNRAGALRAMADLQIGKRGAQNANDVKTSVLEEAFVFGGEDRVHHIFGQIVKADDAALLARTVKKIGDHFRFEFGGVAHGPVRNLRDPRNGRAGEDHAQRVSAMKEGLVGRLDIKRGALHVNLPGRPGDLAILVTGAEKIFGKVAGPQFFAGVNVSGSGINAGGILEDLAGEALVDQMAELNVVIREN